MLKLLLEEIRAIKSSMVTKDDAKNFLTKDDAKKFATKDDLKKFATKKDLKTALAKYATKNDLKRELTRVATKDDLINLRNDLRKDIDVAFGQLTEATVKHKADRDDLIVLARRVDRIEQEIFD